MALQEAEQKWTCKGGEVQGNKASWWFCLGPAHFLLLSVCPLAAMTT